MHDRKDQSNPHPHEGDRNAFAPFFLDHMARREPAPAAPEARSEGPFRIVKLYGDGPPLWACYAAGERQPRLSVEAPDLAYLLAAGMEIAERPSRFGFEPVVGAVGRRAFHLLHDGHPVGTIDLPGDTLPLHLTGLADLRVRPLALAHYLLSVPDETLRRTGHVLIEMLEQRR
jgi:hypothetical protein